MSERRSGGHFVTPDQMENARRNIERYPWAAVERDAAVERARRWVDLDDGTLWGLVAEQTIGRSTTPNVEQGCPTCLDGLSRFEVDVLADPWKIRCTGCGGRFPTNDFGAFYLSGKGPDGLFDPSRADRGLLFNSEHPDPADPLHRFGVDDGLGWTNEAGEAFRLVGVYGHYGIWSEVSAACRALREAFVLTGDPVYAGKAGVLLARIADVYPDMDWSYWARHGFFNSDGLSGRGRIYGRIWEPGLLVTFTECFDAVRMAWRDGDPLFEFLEARQRSLGLSDQDTVDRLCRHFEDHVVREGLQAILDGDVSRNEPGNQVTVAILAVALDNVDTDEWLDWIFKEGPRRGAPNGGYIPQLFSTEIDRDGVGSEAAPSYSLGWLYKGQGMDNLDDALRARPSYTRYRIRDYARYREMFLAHVRMLVLGRYVPPIGDTGKTGEPSLCGLSVAQCLKGYGLFGDPIFAQAAHHLVGGDVEKIRGAIHDANPEEIRARVMDVIKVHGPLRPASDVMTGYGLALLRDGEGDRERTLWLYYGRNRGHGHADRLNLGLHGFGLDLLPDLGYPEHARVWPKRIGWTSHTVSHNTVVVDRGRQKGTYSAKVDFVGIADEAQAVAVSSPDVYPQCSAYGRCSVLVRISGDDFYVVDLFRVVGGRAHHLMFHAAEGGAASGGMKLVEQQKGTYAGEDVGFGEFHDGEVKGYTGSGFQYLYDVRRCADPDRVAWVDWQVKDTWKLLPVSQQAGEPMMTDIHLRWNLLDPPGEVALCHGDPPQTKPGNPRRLTYAVAAHEGDDPLDTGYLSLIEAYVGDRVVEGVEEASVSGGEGSGFRAVKVCLPGDRTDTVVFGDGTTKVRVDRRIDFDGLLGIYSEVGGRARWAMLVGGRLLGTGDRVIQREAGAWTGEVLSRESGKIVTEADLPDEGSIEGCYLSVENDNERDACYRIRQAVREGGQTVIDLGNVDFVRGMVDDLDYAKGFTYDFEVEATFRVIRTWVERW